MQDHKLKHTGIVNIEVKNLHSIFCSHFASNTVQHGIAVPHFGFQEGFVNVTDTAQYAKSRIKTCLLKNLGKTSVMR